MRYLFAARHGDYSGNDRYDEKDELTPRGINQIKTLALAIRKITGSDNICLSSTDARRVIQSAEILQRELNISDYTCVWGRDETGQIIEDTAFKIYSSKEKIYRAMIFVSHECPTAENASYIAARVGFDEKSIGAIRYLDGLGTGRALALDLEQKTFTIIPEIKKPVIKKVEIKSVNEEPPAF